MRNKAQTFFLPIFLTILLSPVWCFSQSKVKKSALIIGNSSYVNQPLTNPVNDADDFGMQLKELGFEVFIVKNQTRSEIRDAIIEYGDYVNSNRGVALFYYAGHGIQSAGTNYIIPLKANINREWEIQDECIKVDIVLRMLQSYKNPANIIILDACRNNPYSRTFRSGESGLANQQYNFTGSIIAYATAPGMTASDGEGRNGLYTQELIKALKIPGLSIEEVFKRVRINVSRISNQQQIPWENSSLMGNYYFNEKKGKSNTKAMDLSEDPIEVVDLEDIPLPVIEKKIARIHISSSYDAKLSSAFEIMHANSGQVDVNMLSNFESFDVSSFGKGNNLDIQLGSSNEYEDTTFFVPRNIRFGRGMAQILESELGNLDSLIQTLKSHPDLRLIVDGHTDFQGNAAANLELSEARVKSIKKHLTSNGIEKDRIIGNAYGGTRPLNLSRTKEARLENRRVEFRFIKKSLNSLMYFKTNEITGTKSTSKRNDNIKELLEDSYMFDVIEKSDIYVTDFVAELNKLKEREYDPFEKLVIYISALSTRDKESGKQLVGFKNSNFYDPITCIDLETIKNRIDQIPAQNIVLITKFKEVSD